MVIITLLIPSALVATVKTCRLETEEQRPYEM